MGCRNCIAGEGWEGHCSNDTAWGAGRTQAGAGRCWARVAGRTARSRRWASVRAGRARRVRQAGVSGRGAQGMLGRAGLACWGAQGGRHMGAGGRARARASGNWAQAGGRALGPRQGAGPVAGRWARGRKALGARQASAGLAGRARPGRLGWPWAVHSVHSAHFRSVLTRFFS